jgi:hypothetical protein
MGRWDRDFKVIGRLRPLDLLGLVPGARARGVARSLDKELASAPPLPRALDQIVEVEEPDGTLAAYQLEFEAEPRSDTGERVFEHWAYSRMVLGRALRLVVFYLAPGKEGRRPQRRFAATSGRTTARFSFEVVCLWKVDVALMLGPQTPGLWALAPLARGAGPAQIERACRLIEGLEDESLSSELLGVWFEVAGVKTSSADLMAMVRRKELLMESSTYKAIFAEGEKWGEEKGEKKGEKRGEEKGEKKGLAHVCRAIAQARLGTQPPEMAALEGLDLERLRRLAEQLSAAASAEAVREALRDLK